MKVETISENMQLEPIIMPEMIWT